MGPADTCAGRVTAKGTAAQPACVACCVKCLMELMPAHSARRLLMLLLSMRLRLQVLFTPAPCMWLHPKRVDKMSQYPHYSCPVYRTAERRGVLATTGHSTNFVMFVRLPTIEPASHWTLNGVALISSLSD